MGNSICLRCEHCGTSTLASVPERADEMGTVSCSGCGRQSRPSGSYTPR